jgi:lysophospholipase L1-like esterase
MKQKGIEVKKRLFGSCAVIAMGLVLLAEAADDQSLTIAVDSPAFAFSPGNWVGDAGRDGKVYRQTWNPGAYFRVTWEATGTNVPPTLLLDTSPFAGDPKFRPPVLACNLDGIWSGDLPCAAEIRIPGMRKDGKHILTVYVKQSQQVKRWGTDGASGANVVRVTGLRLAAGSKPVQAGPTAKWALIVGDSITEGCGAYELEGYSHLLGQAFREMGYEYAISACGWSGWLNRGDNPPGDVPGYYVISNSVDGAGGQYMDAVSRWNKIDANHSLLDSRGRISAYGQTDQDPSVIVINYGTNDSLHRSNPSDTKASIAQCLLALRGAAPGAHIFFIIPFGQYKADEIYQAVKSYKTAHPDDVKVSIIDLGPDAARALTVNGYWGGLHPNPRAHATFGAQIAARIMATLYSSGTTK